MRWMNLELIIQSEVSQKEKDKYCMLMHIYGVWKDGPDKPVCSKEVSDIREQTYGHSGVREFSSVQFSRSVVSDSL